MWVLTRASRGDNGSGLGLEAVPPACQLAGLLLCVRDLPLPTNSACEGNFWERNDLQSFGKKKKKSANFKKFHLCRKGLIPGMLEMLSAGIARPGGLQPREQPRLSRAFQASDRSQAGRERPGRCFPEEVR